MAEKETSKSPEEVKKDELNERVNTFLKEYGELVAKLGIDFASYPVFTPNGRGGFDVIVQNTPVDIKNQPKKSPFMAK